MEWRKLLGRQGQKSWRNSKLMNLKRSELHWKEKEIEQEVRKQWLQEQETSHGYDNDELDFEAQDDDGQVDSDLLSQITVTGPDSASVVTSKKACKCDSTKHLRTSHSDCPLWKDKQVSDTNNVG